MGLTETCQPAQFHPSMHGTFEACATLVRLASSLDEIDRDWQECFAWPKATD